MKQYGADSSLLSREGYVIFGGREACPVDLGGTKILVCIFVVLLKCDVLSP